MTDGPFLYRLQDGALSMLWSSFEDNGGYCIGCARSQSGALFGPRLQNPDPLYAPDGGHAMPFHTFAGQLMMACRCPDDHPKKRILLFRMEEKQNALPIVNEITGNRYDVVGGLASGFAYKETCTEQPAFTPLAAPRRIT